MAAARGAVGITAAVAVAAAKRNIGLRENVALFFCKNRGQGARDVVHCEVWSGAPRNKAHIKAKRQFCAIFTAQAVNARSAISPSKSKRQFCAYKIMCKY